MQHPLLLPHSNATCPAYQLFANPFLESSFFHRTFDAVLSIGLMFLLKPEEQHRLIRNIADILVPGGRLLFTSTVKPHVWRDVMTGMESISLGTSEYVKQLTAVGLSVISEFEDEGQNHYFDALKADQNV